MHIVVLGADGYIGWALTQHLIGKGHHVIGVDNIFRRETARSVVPVQEFEIRRHYVERAGGSFILADAHLPTVPKIDAIVNLAQLPSAPYSMAAERTSRQAWKNTDEVNAILWQMKLEHPEAHLIHIGSMGEYGTPNCVIPEGTFSHTDADGNTDELIFPRRPSSIYHTAKVASTYMIEACCRWWGLRSTDIMQGVVFGCDVPGNVFPSRVDVDETWGTVLHRFCARAVAGVPLTVYGTGEHKRSFLTLVESVQCLTLALENPPAAGEYRTWNQFSQVYSMNELAAMVHGAAKRIGLGPIDIEHIPSPRVEAAKHFYQPEAKKLEALGFLPWGRPEHEHHIEQVLLTLLEHKERAELLVVRDEELTTWR